MEHKGPANRQTNKPRNRLSPTWVRPAVAAFALLAVGVLAWGAVSNGVDAHASRLLRSPDPHERKRGAWLGAERNVAPAAALMVARLKNGQESSADVRESYVYALGRMHSQADLIESIIARDESGYVRQAAWSALARFEPIRFRKLARSLATETNDAWSRIGMAQGRLWLADVSGVGELLYWAETGNDDQRLVASRALYKALRPMLDIAGRWPIEADVEEGRIWPTELAAEVRRRCAGLDLQALVDDSRPHLERGQRVRRNVQRLTRARERLKRWLFSG